MSNFIHIIEFSLALLIFYFILNNISWSGLFNKIINVLFIIFYTGFLSRILMDFLKEYK